MSTSPNSTWTADEWNRAHPVGASVVYTPIKGEPEVKHSTTRSKAWTLGHGAVIVKIEGITGGVSIDHLEPESALGEPRVFGIKDGQALVRFPTGEVIIPEIDVAGPVPKVGPSEQVRIVRFASVGYEHEEIVFSVAADRSVAHLSGPVPNKNERNLAAVEVERRDALARGDDAPKLPLFHEPIVEGVV